jgi:hypothetical protein
LLGEEGLMSTVDHGPLLLNESDLRFRHQDPLPIPRARPDIAELATVPTFRLPPRHFGKRVVAGGASGFRLADGGKILRRDGGGQDLLGHWRLVGAPSQEPLQPGVQGHALLPPYRGSSCGTISITPLARRRLVGFRRQTIAPFTPAHFDGILEKANLRVKQRGHSRFMRA